MKIVKIQFKDVWPRTDGEEPRNNAPVLDYCRKLVREGNAQRTKLEVYRGDVLCLTVKSVIEGARLDIIENEKKGPILVKHRPKPSIMFK